MSTERFDTNRLHKITIRLSNFATTQTSRRDGLTKAERTRRVIAALTDGAGAYSPNGGRSSIGGHSDPTQNAALNPDPVNVWNRQLAAEWLKLEAAMNAIENLTIRARHRSERLSRFSNDRKTYVCANTFCGDDILDLDIGETPYRARCKPCGEYLDKHDQDAGPKVIADRRRQREIQASRKLAAGQAASLDQMTAM